MIPARRMEKISDSMAWLTRRNGSILVGYGPFEAAAAAPKDGLAFYVQDYALSDPLPWKIPSHSEETAPTNLSRAAAPKQGLDCVWDHLDATGFSGVFQEIMIAIHSGVFEKTVPVVTERGRAKSSVGPAIIAAMARQHAPLQSYGWVDGDSGFAGATPELLFSLNGLELKTMALAGTARSEDQDVFAVDEKEIREHEYVAQTLVSKLLHLGKLRRETREILNLGSIVHFLTTIRVSLHQPLMPEDLIHRLHPTPALGPLPRTEETMEQLIGWRERLGCPAGFGAPFGLWEYGEFHAVVAIRGTWWQGQDLCIPAGCGIIEASRLVNEWRELRLKREAVKRSLSIIQNFINFP